MERKIPRSEILWNTPKLTQWKLNEILACHRLKSFTLLLLLPSARARNYFRGTILTHFWPIHLQLLTDYTLNPFDDDTLLLLLLLLLHWLATTKWTAGWARYSIGGSERKNEWMNNAREYRIYSISLFLSPFFVKMRNQLQLENQGGRIHEKRKKKTEKSTDLVTLVEEEGRRDWKYAQPGRD